MTDYNNQYWFCDCGMLDVVPSSKPTPNIISNPNNSLSQAQQQHIIIIELCLTNLKNRLEQLNVSDNNTSKPCKIEQTQETAKVEAIEMKSHHHNNYYSGSRNGHNTHTLNPLLPDHVLIWLIMVSTNSLLSWLTFQYSLFVDKLADNYAIEYGHYEDELIFKVLDDYFKFITFSLCHFICCIVLLLPYFLAFIYIYIIIDFFLINNTLFIQLIEII